jgi:hypothetical protein
MTYSDDISALSPEHHWKLDLNSNDAIGSVNGVDTAVTYPTVPIAEDATSCLLLNTINGDRVVLPTTTDINNSAQARKALGGWFSISSINAHPVRIYGEGNQSTAFQFVLAYGNNLLFEVIEPTNFTIQIYSDNVVANDRAYHIIGLFEGNGYDNEARFFVDGIEQTNAEPISRQPGNADLNLRAAGTFGDSTATVGVGGGVVLLQGPTDGSYNHWASWGDTVNAELTATEIREELFEKGALPGTTISAGTEAVMQTALDLLANTVRGDEPLNIEVQANTGDTDFTLTADNITHDSLASIHVRYMGTAILTWRNDNGSDASIFSTPNGGTVLVETETNLTINGLQNPTEVRIYDAGTVTEIGGQEDVTTGTFSVDLFETSVDIRFVSLNYKIFTLYTVDTSADLALEITQIFDRNYVNA